MSTQLGVINKNVVVTRYWGGTEKGVSVQITPIRDVRYVSLTASEIIALLPMLKSVIDMELGRRKAETEKAIDENKDLLKTIAKDMRDVSQMAISQPVYDMAALLSLGAAKVTDSEESDREA